MLKKSYAAPGPMGGHGRRPAEKPRDFSGTWGRLIRYCRAYLPAVGVALATRAVTMMPATPASRPLAV